MTKKNYVNRRIRLPYRTILLPKIESGANCPTVSYAEEPLTYIYITGLRAPIKFMLRKVSPTKWRIYRSWIHGGDH